jgi:twitching motility two-component system response regulator PilG
MKTILLVDDEKQFLGTTSKAITDYADGFNVITALDGIQAVHILNSTKVDVVITDLFMPQMDGFQLTAYITRNHENIPVITLAGLGISKIEERLKQMGVVHQCLQKPIKINMLIKGIFSALAARSEAHIHGFSLATFLQAVEMEQKSCTLWIASKGRVGYLYLKDGALIDAETEGLEAEEAAIEIFCWDEAEIKILDIYKKERTITTPLKSVLFNAFRIKDERSYETLARHEDLLNEAIVLVEGHHYGEAQEVFARFFKLNPKNPKGWLWYSRILGNMRSIEKSLGNAAKLSPKDPEVMEEINKFHLAKRNIGEGRVRRCPFCWVPIEKKAVYCEYCGAYLVIKSRFFSSPQGPNENILAEAVERYTKVIGREKNVTVHFYLSMAHLNLGHWEEALSRLHKTVELAPDNQFFSVQLRKLTNYMASTKEPLDDEASTGELYDKTLVQKTIKLKERHKKRILVVEDSSTTRKVITVTLSQSGYQVIEAADGLEALSKLNNEERPDLILLDIILPKMDGFRVLSNIKSNPEFKPIPVIMLTGRDSLIDKIKAKVGGSTKYLTKPFKPDELLETIKRYI